MPQILDGIKFIRSSNFAAPNPNNKYFSDLYPIILSAVFVILYRNNPGNPNNKYQKTGARTASEKFSAALSTAALLTFDSSKSFVWRPTMQATALLPSLKLLLKPTETSLTCLINELCARSIVVINNSIKP